jgi:ParB-like chromosome segregation protein Spo0J
MSINITQITIGRLRKFKGNPQEMTKEMMRSLAKSIKEHGFIVPLVVDETNRVLGGEQRWRVAKALGLTSVPCIIINTGGDEVKAKKINLGLNRIHGDFNYELLLKFVEDLESSDLTSIGFDSGEIEELLGQLEEAEENEQHHKEELEDERLAALDRASATEIVKFKFGGFVTPIDNDDYEKFLYVYDSFVNMGKLNNEQQFIHYLIRLASKALDSNVRKNGK